MFVTGLLIGAVFVDVYACALLRSRCYNYNNLSAGIVHRKIFVKSGQSVAPGLFIYF